jgi:hypothetical protein
MIRELLISALALAPTATASVHHFESKDHSFSADYPSSWEQMRAFGNGATDNQELDIINFPNRERLEGTIIKNGGAEIILRTGKAPERLEAGDKLIARHTITLPSAPFCSAVSELRIDTVVATKPNGEDVLEDDTTYECSRGSASFTLVLRHWKDDPKHQSYERTALEILKTLRVY